MTRQDRRGGRGAAAFMGFMVLLLSGCGTPQLAQPPSYPNFTQADLDHDHVVTQEEWLQAGLHQFDTLDTNHDGKIDAAEIEAARQTLDRNHDGTVTTDEVIPPFAAYDTDKDGTVSPAEFNKGLVQDLGGTPGATEVYRDQLVKQINSQFKKADKNNDGRGAYDDLYNYGPTSTVFEFPLYSFY
ncbi:EF-hand domain-containing protein [Hypericibacter terrae]|nr:EF-hand domain-containing protein [Hypericibacter terrae]